MLQERSNRRPTLGRVWCIGAAAGLLAAAAAQPTASTQDDTSRQVFTAFAVSTGGPRTAPVAEQVQITIDGWTTSEQRKTLATALAERDADGALEELRRLPEVGFIRTPDSLGYPLRYAAQEPLPDGGRRIVLATDRPIRFWETWSSSRTLDYPFTVVELQMNANGEGEGKLALATRIIPLDGRILLENWSVAPVHLKQVQRQS
jgi:hypothetical protein